MSNGFEGLDEVSLGEVFEVSLGEVFEVRALVQEDCPQFHERRVQERFEDESGGDSEGSRQE